MSFDDVANDPENKFPGQLFNNPRGPDVYAGCAIDYRGDDVTPTNFMAILTGNSSGVNGGNGRVLTSGPGDRVFVYFADHGNSGIICFPDGGPLTAHDLNETIHEMHEQRKYEQLVVYVEACLSGSMFESILPDDIGVYVMTAANSHEVSYGTYCGCPGVGANCLGDKFSINWMEESETSNLNKLTLNGQYEVVKNLTDRSHVQHFGNLSIGAEFVGFFEGSARQTQLAVGPNVCSNTTELKSWSVSEIPIRMIEFRLREETHPHVRFQLSQQLDEIHAKRAHFDSHTQGLVDRLSSRTNWRFMKRMMDREVHEPISDLKCHDQAVKTYARRCFNFSASPYAMKVAGTLNKLCNSHLTTDQIVKAIEEHCPTTGRRVTGIR